MSRANRFWQRMIELYGVKWLNSYGDEPTEMWINLIGTFEDYQIQWVIKSLMSPPKNEAGNNSAYVPTMPQISILAKSAHKPPQQCKTLGAEQKEYTPEQCEANRKKLKRVSDAALRGDFKGLEEWQINEIIKDW